MKRFRVLSALAIVACFGTLYFIAHALATPNLPTTVAPPSISAGANVTHAIDVTDVNKQEYIAQLEREGKIIWMMGPKTKGKTIDLAGQKVKLPADAWVDDYAVDIECAPSLPCPDEVPFMVIARGNSRIYVTEHQGKVFHSNIKPGEEELFSFLKGVVAR